MNHAKLPVWTLSLLLTGAAFAQSTEVQGRIEDMDGVRLLRVWGSAEDMGYAHGYLLGEDAARLYQADLQMVSGGNAAALAANWAKVLPALTVPDPVRRELEAFLQGARDASGGEGPMLEALGRPLSLDDLILYNSRDAIRAFGCSGFTAWGEEVPGGVVTTRNFDFPIPGKVGIDLQMLLVRHPEDGHAVATVTWPGYLGAFTGVNEHGVCAFMHDGTGARHSSPKRRYTPASLALFGFLKGSRAAEAHSEARDTLDGLTPYPFSYLVRVITPRDGSNPPVSVYRIDAEGVSSNPDSGEFCVVTNHYLDLDGEPVASAGDWTRKRYAILEEYAVDGVASDSLWQAMDAVSSSSPANPTVHTLVVYPEEQRLELALATWTGQAIAPATRSEPKAIPFAQLFAAPGR